MAQVNLGHVKGDKGDTGSQGPQGIQGIQGVQGPAGPGCPTGGTANQVLMKASGTDYDYNWSNINFATQRTVAFAVATNEWTLSNGVYTAEFTTAYITSTSFEELYVDNSFYTYGKTQIKATKKSGGGGLILTTETIPTGTITGVVKIVDADDGKVPVIIEDTTVPIANGGTGQSTVAGVRSAFSIPDVVDNLTTNDGTKALSAKQGYTLNSKIADSILNLGILSTLPALNSYGNGMYAFAIDTAVTVSGVTIPAGTRIFGYKYGVIYHGVAISPSSTYTLRYGLVSSSTPEWSVVNNLTDVSSITPTLNTDYCSSAPTCRRLGNICVITGDVTITSTTPNGVTSIVTGYPNGNPNNAWTYWGLMANRSTKDTYRVTIDNGALKTAYDEVPPGSYTISLTYFAQP